MGSKQFTIGELAKACGITTDTLRYYEKRGLIPKAARAASSGYRVYLPETLEHLGFIRQAQYLGFTLAEIEELLRLRADSEASCAQIRDIAQAKIREAQEQIETLQQIVDGLENLAGICPGDVPADKCPLIEMLKTPEN
ncbi:MAG: heavy metal-responsive transcriptional regulator [Bradymonadaceae bacterium]|nr:heavy metal-responsive transcriptional regulator [Lujinxingiaceae bacterium]